jgi:c-di-GMP-binding flagellar brake protein YcgR
MEAMNMERRKAQRYAIHTKVMIHREHGEPISAVATDISSAGMLVHPDQPAPFRLGETVTVEVELPDDSDQPFSPWGVGRIVRLDGEHSAIQLSAGCFRDGADESEDRPAANER